MNRIERIQKEIERFNNKPDYIHATGPVIIEWLQHLLSKLEIAEKALEWYADETGEIIYATEDVLTDGGRRAREALQQIRA